MRNGWREPSRLAVGGSTLAAVVVLWYLATTFTQIIPPVYFPTPAEVLQAFRQITVQGYADGQLQQHFLHSCWLVLMGFAAAVGLGVPLGMLMGWSRGADAKNSGIAPFRPSTRGHLSAEAEFHCGRCCHGHAPPSQRIGESTVNSLRCRHSA